MTRDATRRRRATAVFLSAILLVSCADATGDVPEGFSVLAGLNPAPAASGGSPDGSPRVPGSSDADGTLDPGGFVSVPSLEPDAGSGGPAVAGDAQTGSSPIGEGGVAASEEPVAAPALRMGPGVTDTEIRVGFQVSEDLQAGFAAVGASGDTADERVIIEALVDHVNENGGLGGRTLVPVFHGTNALSGSWSSQAQAACATFTEDNEVFAVVSSTVGGSDALLACTASRRTPLIEQNLWVFDRQYYDRFQGWLYQPGKMRADRWARAYAEGLADAGFLDEATVGLVRFDAPVFGRVTEGVVAPTLQARGIAIDETAILSTPQSVSDFGRLNSEISNAIVRFRAAGVDRVLFIENAGILPFFWMPAAESQGYRPRYGLSSNSIPATMARQAPERQLQGSLGIGWTPPNDVDTSSDFPPNPAADRCEQVLRERGIPPTWAGFYTHSACEAIFFLQALVPQAPALDAGGFRAAVDSLGASYRGPFAIGTVLGPDRHDGAAVAQRFTFRSACGCFRYEGQPWKVP